MAYKLVGGPRFLRVPNLTVVNQFGTIVVDAIRRSRLLVPSSKSLGDPPPPLSSASGALIDHFECYRTRRSHGAARFTPISGVTLVDQFGSTTVKVVEPRLLCNPVNKNGERPGAETHSTHLMCYSHESTVPLNMSREPIFVNNQFGPQTLHADHRDILCVPSLKNPTSSTTTITVATTTSTTTTTAPP